ncbi:protein TraG [Neisseria gonorrhoeae]|uniref:Protein TraG n=1 Tax=Neisseria gonorrhoeae TaxID=485 RepID=A0A378VXK8_NEIGO|nr:protein TraG [Neisseria gonorrhoeae]
MPGYIADRVFAGLGTNSAGINRVNALVTLGNSSFQYLLDNARFDTLKISNRRRWLRLFVKQALSMANATEIRLPYSRHLLKFKLVISILQPKKPAHQWQVGIFP